MCDSIPIIMLKSNGCRSPISASSFLISMSHISCPHYAAVVSRLCLRPRLGLRCNICWAPGLSSSPWTPGPSWSLVDFKHTQPLGCIFEGSPDVYGSQWPRLCKVHCKGCLRTGAYLNSCAVAVAVLTYFQSQTPSNRANFNQPDVWTLYITATAPSKTRSGQPPSTSPCATLERFTGSNSAVDAPEWTQWAHPIEEFQQPRASFGVLFARMAFWKVNRDDVCVPYVWCLFNLLTTFSLLLP